MAPKFLMASKASVRKTHQWIIRDSGLYAALKVLDVGSEQIRECLPEQLVNYMYQTL